jgi:hypothetical protein
LKVIPFGTLDPYQNLKSTVPNSYVHNPNNKQDIKNRETTKNSEEKLEN